MKRTTIRLDITIRNHIKNGINIIILLRYYYLNYLKIKLCII